MKSAVVIALALVLCVLAIVAFLLFRSRDAVTPGGFRDWVKNPDYKHAAEQYFAERDALTVPDDISQDEIQTMVDRLFVEGDDDFNLDKLKLVGDKATPLLIAALNSDRAFKATFSEGGHSFDAQSPFERICNLLEETCPPAAVNALKRYAAHPDGDFRKHAAIALGNIGTDACIDPIVKLLGDEDDYVRSYAMMGIERGIDGDRCTDNFLNSVFPALQLLLDRDDSSISGTAPKLMLAINQERAKPIMLSEKFFTHKNEELHYIVEAFNEAEVPIPHGKLLPLIDVLQPLVETYPHDYQLAMALIAYSRNPDQNTEKILSRLRNCPKERVTEAAADGLAMLAGVTDPSTFVFEKLDSHGWDGLSVEQQHYYAVLVYNAEVNNGGHSQYFVNSSGENHPTALAGLRAIGAAKRSAILLQALQLFGEDGPSTDNETRHEQLAAFSKRLDLELDSLNSQYYQCDENIDVLLSSYALANREHFSQVR
jgi:HEAT repeat protein